MEYSVTDSTKSRMIIIVYALVFFVSLGESLASPVVPLLADSFNVKYSMIGFLVVSYAVGYCIFTLLAGGLSDKYGRKPLILISLAVVLAGSTAFCFTNNFWVLLIAKFFEGSSRGAMWPLCAAVIADNVSDAKRNSVTSKYTVSYALSCVIGYIVSGILFEYFGIRAPLYLYPMCIIVLLCLVVFIFKDTKVFHKDESAEKKEPITAKIADTAKELKKFIPLYLASFAYVGYIFCNSGMFAIMANKMNVGTIGISVLFCSFWITRVIMFFLFEKIADKYSYARIIEIGLVFMIVALTLYIAGFSIVLLALGMVLGGVGTSLIYPAVVGTITRDGDKAKQGLLMGFWEFCGSLGGFTQSVMAGVTGEMLGANFTFLFTLIVFAVTFVFVARFNRKHGVK